MFRQVKDLCETCKHYVRGDGECPYHYIDNDCDATIECDEYENKENTELVIKIPKVLYEAYKGRLSMFGDVGMDTIAQAIANGTQIPKGHGDLIDRGNLNTHFIGTEQGTDLEVYLEPTIINAPTIIEADRED